MKKLLILVAILLLVQNVDAIAKFTISNITDDPDFLRLNEEFDYSFTIKNTGDEPAEIRTTLKETGLSVQSGFGTKDQNFLAGQTEMYSWTFLTTGCTGKAQPAPQQLLTYKTPLCPSLHRH